MTDKLLYSHGNKMNEYNMLGNVLHYDAVNSLKQRLQTDGTPTNEFQKYNN